MNNAQPKASVRALLTGIVDYAGLFPPSQVAMPQATANYAAYLKSEYRWMLGRFVVPVGRLAEFAEIAEKHFADGEPIWRLSVLASDDIYETVRQITEFNDVYANRAVCDALEVKARTSLEIDEICRALPEDLPAFFEIPLNESLADLISTLAINGQCAKIRTGGLTEDVFPAIEGVARFMRVCLAANVPFKATAGLHHPLRCLKALTYEPDAPEGTMHGFLNVFLAAVFLHQGYQPRVIYELLRERRADNFLFTDDGILWRQEHFVNSLQIENVRIRGAISFGSCSFVEPIEDLQEIGLL